MAATEGALQFANPMIAAYLFKDWGWGEMERRAKLTGGATVLCSCLALGRLPLMTR